MVRTDAIAAAVHDCIVTAATTLRPDVVAALERAAVTETSSRGRAILAQLLDNACIASDDSVPLCQDTGTVWVRIELGSDEAIGGDLQVAIDGAVASAFRDHALRMSVAADALLDRANTGDNTPAFIDIVSRPGAGARVHVMLKGGGSDNASVVAMLDPGAGFEGVRDVVVAAVRAKGSSACPPLLVGVGVGSTFDRVGSLAKHALLRDIGPARDKRIAAFEAELLEAVNATGIGPGGLGGSTTALAVHIETAPCHIAAMPVAVNLGCCAVRSASVEL
ncbi:MAG: fumarate hydratase [Coriobacteriia bacterium]|nr:fumarate hydratase [Coriobacteriia bacterium]